MSGVLCPDVPKPLRQSICTFSAIPISQPSGLSGAARGSICTQKSQAPNICLDPSYWRTRGGSAIAISHEGLLLRHVLLIPGSICKDLHRSAGCSGQTLGVTQQKVRSGMRALAVRMHVVQSLRQHSTCENLNTLVSTLHSR